MSDEAGEVTDTKPEATAEVAAEVEEGEEMLVAPIKRLSLASVGARLFQRSLGYSERFQGPMARHHCGGM
jgi:hypothetical protein